MLSSTKLVLLLFMLLVEESSRIILHRRPSRHPPHLIKPLGIYYMLTSRAMINLIQCYSVLQQYAYNYCIGLGCSIMVVKSMYYIHKIPNIELVILCVLHHSRPKRKQCSRTMGGQDPPPKAPSSWWPPYTPVLS